MLVIQPESYIQPDTDMKILLKYYPKMPLEYGPTKQEIKIYTNDDSLPYKKFYISANIVENFEKFRRH